MKCLALAIALAVASTAAAQEKKDAPAPLFPDAKPLVVKTLGTPVMTMPNSWPTWAPNADGKGWTRLLFYHHYTMKIPCQTVAINTATGEVKKFVIEKAGNGTGPWRYTVGHDGKSYMGHYGSGSVWIYDPAKMNLSFAESGFKNIGTVSAIAAGTDGKIYCSTTPKIISFQFDPATGKFTDYGIQGRARNYLGYGYTVAADDEYVYTAAGKIPWELVAYNKKTGEQKVLVTADGGDYLGVGQDRYGCTAQVSYLAGPRKGERDMYWLYKGQAIPRTAKETVPPWPVPADAQAPAWPPKPEEMLDDATPGADGKAVYLYRLPGAKTDAAAKVPPDADPARLGWKSVEYSLTVGPGKITDVRETPDGRILGVGPAYLDWFIFDPKGDRTTILGKIPLSHYDTVFTGGKAYMVGYPTMPIYEFDLTKPWTPGKGTPQKPSPAIDAPGSNPRRLAYLGSLVQTHHGRAAAVGADGLIYVAGHAERAHVGGGLAWWDPKEQKAGGLREPFELFDAAGICATDGGRKIVYSSSLVTDPATGKKADAAKLFVFDTEKRQLIGSFAPFPGRTSTGRIVSGSGATVVGFVAGPPTNLLYRADAITQKVVQHVELPVKLGGDFRLGPDGRIWTFADNVLVRIDPETLALEPVGSVDVPGRMAFAGQNLYLGGTTELRRVENVLTGRR